MCLVRYEDLLHAAEDTFTRALRTCGLERDERRVAKAIAFSRFEQLRDQELEHRFREMPAHTRDPFFRRGEAGWGRSELTSALVRAITAAHGEAMALLG